ncbi:murein biosynthesis integral membrane protein MurJ [Niallia sp. Krafla_26]|uniref:murein biosynthesis integral membrane protein MurJ n=1 Tax=Niallia sp. Krafla_26 TaxID=3064703 RepID=UPI003D166A3D
MKKTAVMLMILTILSTTIGFSRELILSFYYGASYITDAYLISLIIPQTLIAFIGAVIGSIYIPMYRNIEHEISIKRADEFTSNIINVLFFLCSAIILLVLIFTPLFVKIFAVGFKGEIFNLTVNFTRVSIFAIYFSILASLFSSYLQLKNNFVVGGILSIPLNLIIILSLVFSSEYNIYILSFGSVLGAFFQLLFIIPFVKKSGFKYRFIINKKDVYIKKLVSLSMPVMLGVSVYQLNTLIDKTIASQVITGGISSLSYASRVNALVFGLFAVPIATVMYPMISKMSAEKKLKKLKETVSKAFLSILLLVVPATIGSMVLAEPIIRLLFGRGAFDNSDIQMTASALFFYSIGMLGVSLREILYRTFYSLQDTRTPLVNAAIAMVLNIIFSIVLSKLMGIAGIALATSISSILCAILLFVNLRRKIGVFSMKNLFSTFLKILLASVIMGFLTLKIYAILIENFSLYLTLFITIIISGGVYILLINFMKIKEFDEALFFIKEKINLKHS